MRMRVGYRWRIALCGLGVVALGLVSRRVPLGLLAWDKYLGDSAYAAMVYFGLAWLQGYPRMKRIALIALALCCAIEAFQLTGIPLALVQSPQPLVRLFARLVLGSSFSWWDILAYLVGVAGALGLDKLTAGLLGSQQPPAQ
jgi:hypothetical protein